jgi:hypothetical protein
MVGITCNNILFIATRLQSYMQVLETCSDDTIEPVLINRGFLKPKGILYSN